MELQDWRKEPLKSIRMNSNFVWLNWHHNPVLVWPRLLEKMASMMMLFSNGSDSSKTKGVYHGVFR